MDPPSASAVAYTWDDNGNLTDRGSHEFAWDEADRMVSATVNSTTTTFAYRGDGLRESRTVGMSTTTFTWDVNAGLPVILYDGSYYLYGFGPLRQRPGPSLMLPSSPWRCLHSHKNWYKHRGQVSAKESSDDAADDFGSPCCRLVSPINGK